MYNIYCDEVWPEKEGYIFLIAVAIKKEDLTKVAEILNSKRCKFFKKWVSDFNNCKFNNTCNLKTHDLCNSEIHFSQLKDTVIKHNVSRAWLELLEYELKDLLRFNILIINKNNLDWDKFDIKNNVKIHIYFFKTLIKGLYNYSLKYWNLPNQPINQIYHHQGPQEKFMSFNKNISKLEINKIPFINTNIKFLNSNHRNYENVTDKFNAILIQFSDLLVGSLRQVMLKSSDNINKIETSKKIHNIFVKNKYGYYSIKECYKNKYSISLWPNKKYISKDRQITLDDFFVYYNKNSDLFSNDINLEIKPIENKKLFDF